MYSEMQREQAKLEAVLETKTKLLKGLTEEVSNIESKLILISDLIKLYTTVQEPIQIKQTVINKVVKYEGNIYQPVPRMLKTGGFLDHKRTCDAMREFLSEHGPMPALTLQSIFNINAVEYHNIRSKRLKDAYYDKSQRLCLYKTWQEETNIPSEIERPMEC